MDTDRDPKEIFEATLKWWDCIYTKFEKEFLPTHAAKVYRDVLWSFLYDANRDAGNMRYRLKHDELPVIGRPHKGWDCYVATTRHIRLMELMLYLAERKAEDEI